jgi:hypothetical protein
MPVMKWAVCMPVTSAMFWQISQTPPYCWALWSQPPIQEGTQAVVAQSEIRAVRRVVKQLPAETL